jgi:hypothetical protein
MTEYRRIDNLPSSASTIPHTKPLRKSDLFPSIASNMLFQNHLIISAYAIATTNAAVKFYGSERPEGDYVTCTVTNVTDDYVSAGLGMLYFPGEVVPESTDLQFDEPLVCGDFASVAVEFACSDLGGNATCITTHTAEDAEDGADVEDDTVTEDDTATKDDTAEKDADTVSKRSPTQLEKRSGAACNQWTSQCRNEYQSTSGWCGSGYKTEYYDVKGYSTDIWCTKPCTDEEVEVCQGQVCTKGKAYCEKGGYADDCAKALATCPGSPVKMPEDYCTAKYMTPSFYEFCDGRKPACVVYKDGVCTLNADHYAAFVKKLEAQLHDMVWNF